MAFVTTLALLSGAPGYGQTSVCVPWVEKIPADYAAQQKKYNGFRIGDELMGGMYEQNQTAEVIAELLHYPFHFLPPDKVGEAMRHRPVRACKTSEEGW